MVIPVKKADRLFGAGCVSMMLSFKKKKRHDAPGYLCLIPNKPLTHSRASFSFTSPSERNADGYEQPRIYPAKSECERNDTFVSFVAVENSIKGQHQIFESYWLMVGTEVVQRTIDTLKGPSECSSPRRVAHRNSFPMPRENEKSRRFEQRGWG